MTHLINAHYLKSLLDKEAGTYQRDGVTIYIEGPIRDPQLVSHFIPSEIVGYVIGRKSTANRVEQFIDVIRRRSNVSSN